MIYISKDRQIHVVWSIFRGTSDVHEDFSRALVKVFLIGNYEKYLLEAVAEGGNLVFDIPQGLPEGAYSLEAIWVKNYNNLLPCSDTLTPSVDSGCRNQPLRWPFKHPHDHRFNDRCIMRSRKDFVFALTEYDSESTFYKDSGEAEIKIRSAVATYGYDGLSAYEIAVLRGDFNGTEGEYLDSLKFKLEVAQEHKLGGITAVTKTDDETEEVKVDPETGRLYVKPGEGSLSVATETKLGGIKAATKTSLETQEVKIDPVTGKLYTQPGGEGGVEIVNNPDEEDLHSVEQSADVHVLQFADKEHNASSFSGLGRVYLRKNISDGKNVLTQAMMNKANTRYIIQYDYDLDRETITVPEGCTLDFQGGSLKNGNIEGIKTVINSDPIKIFGSDVTIAGTWDILYAYPEWFGAKTGDDTFDNEPFIAKAFTLNNHVKLVAGTYYLGNPLHIDIRYKFEGEFDKSVLSPTASIDTLDCVLNCMNTVDAVSYGYIRNMKIDGKDKAIHGLKCTNISNGTIIENIDVQNCTEAGLYLTRSWYAVYRNIRSWFNKYGLYLDNNLESDKTKGAINGIQFQNCWFNHNSENAVYHTGIYGSALSFSGCTFENSSGDAEVKFTQLYNDVSFYSCYIETNTKLFDIASYGKSGYVNIIGGIFYQRNDDEQYGIFSNVSTISMINCAWRNTGNTSTVDSLFQITGGKCFVVGPLPFSAQTFNDDADVFVIGTLNNYSQTTRGCLTKSIVTNRLSALSHESASEPSTAMLQVGANQGTDVPSNFGCYRLRFVLNKEENRFECQLATASGSSSTTEHIPFWINQWADMKFESRVKGLFASGYGNSSPAYANDFKGMLYYNTDLERLTIMHQGNGTGKWVDCDGFTANKKRGLTSDRPTLTWDDRGFVFYDHTLQKCILWNGSTWVNIDGTPFDINVYYPTTKEKFNIKAATYKIVRNIDLGGESITIPENCTLDFQGGKITNGTLVLWKTKVLPMGCNISDYITATIQNQYAEGQILYDPSLKKMKLYNGSTWVNLDGTALE